MKSFFSRIPFRGKVAAPDKPKSTRVDLIGQVLESVLENINPERFNFIEIGCMFNEREGLSTYEIAKCIKEKGLNARFVSIEYNPEHINDARSLMNEYDKSLIDIVDFQSGHSIEVLPSILEEMGEVHFALLDGGAHPDICLKELELISRFLSDKCALVIDDMVELKPTENYPAPRPLGKCTLIYPALIMADYLRTRRLNRHMAPDFKTDYESSIIQNLDEKTFGNLLGDDMDFVSAGNPNGHQMLIYGNRKIVERVRQMKD